MIPALAHLFRGDHAAIGDALVLADDPRPYMPGSDMRDDTRLRQRLADFARNYAEPDPMAVATQWSKWHFSLLLTPVIAANLAADWQLPLAFDEIGIVLSPDSRTLAIRVAHEGGRQSFAAAEDRFALLVDEHLAPLIAALAQASGLPKKVLWNNAGNVVENTIQDCAVLLGDAHPAIEQARALLAMRTRPGGGRNELFAPVAYVGEELRRRRRICCLRYRMASLPLCKTCPLDEIPKKLRAGAAE